MSIAVESTISFTEPVAETQPTMPRIAVPTPEGPLVLTFVEQVPGTDVWRAEGQRNGRGAAKFFYVRVLPPLTQAEMARRVEFRRRKAILAAKGWPTTS